MVRERYEIHLPERFGPGGGGVLPAGPGNEGRKFEMPGPYPQFTLEIRLSFNPKGYSNHKTGLFLLSLSFFYLT